MLGTGDTIGWIFHEIPPWPLCCQKFQGSIFSSDEDHNYCCQFRGGGGQIVINFFLKIHPFPRIQLSLTWGSVCICSRIILMAGSPMICWTSGLFIAFLRTWWHNKFEPLISEEEEIFENFLGNFRVIYGLFVGERGFWELGTPHVVKNVQIIPFFCASLI